MLNIKQLAKKATTIAEIFGDKEKISTEDIIRYYPNGIHINKIEYISIDNEKNFWAYTFKEAPDKFAFAGHILSKIFDCVLEECEGDYAKTYEEFEKSGGFYAVLKNGKTKSGMNVTLVDIL